VLTNGVHATHEIAHDDEVAWLDCYMLRNGHNCPGGIADPRKRVQIHFETTGPGNNPFKDKTNPPYVTSDYPAPETNWKRYYLHDGGALSTAKPSGSAAGRTYFATPVGRQSYLSGAGVADVFGDQAETTLDSLYSQGYGPPTSSSGPDELTYALRFGKTTALSGPIEADLWASSTAPDTDFFVQLVDEAPDGSFSYLQRGMLRASFRAVDPAMSDRVATGPHKGEIYRAYHPFTDAQQITPGSANLYRLEIFPIGNVFRPGHRLLVQIYAPPAMDELYAYASAQAPAVNTILDDAHHPSSILLPFLPQLPPVVGKAPKCGTQTGVRCVTPSG
jgi:predicted acyl esterase